MANRSFGGAQVSRTFYARGQTGQQLLLGAYQALERQIGRGGVKMFPRTEMLDLVVVDGLARGIVTRNLVTGAIESHAADAVVLATGGYGNIYYLSTNAQGSNATAIWRAYKRGAAFANPCFTQIHPTCIPVSHDYQSKLTLMSESLRNDGRVWVPKQKGDKRKPREIPENERDYYLERKYPSFGNLAPRDIASRAAKEVCDEGRGVGETGLGVYLDFADAIKRLGADVIRERYGNLFEMYERITDENPYEVPMRIYPAVHYTMGGLWVDYNLMGTIDGLHVTGEANFSDHGANRLGASALMQGLADGYFIIPNTIGDYLASHKPEKIETSHAAFKGAERDVAEKTQRLLSIDGKRTVTSFHRELGKIMWDYCGMSRNEAGLKTALAKIPELREEFWRNVNVPGSDVELNQALERAGRVADFLELGELMCLDALDRQESCGAHFREEFQTPDGEALRDDHHSPMSRPGSMLVRETSNPAQRAAGVREREAVAAELQVNLTLHVWRQAGPDKPGKMVEYEARDISPDMSFLEMLDVVNERLTERGDVPIAFDHDCREGICGMCSLMINGIAHGPMKGTATCQLHMRSFKDGDDIYIEPWRARAFPVIKDLTVDLIGPDRIIQAGGFVTAPTGGAQTRTRFLISKESVDHAMDAAALIGCGACAPRPVQMLGHAFGGQDHASHRCHRSVERYARALKMVEQMELEDFRQLHATWRVSGGLSEGDQHRHDHPHESDFHSRAAAAGARP